MDLLTVVAVSMLPVSRSLAATTFKQICRDPREDSTERLLERVLLICGVNSEPAVTESIALATGRARQALSAARIERITPLTIFDPGYPPLLSAIPDPPPVLWLQGEPNLLSRPTVAIVGSRVATTYALEVAERLGAELADRGMVIASGLARGVDSAAHRGCLDAGGRTTAVLGSGVDRIYPAEHGELAARIRKTGVLVSELGPGAAPLCEHFPLRNRIISGISLAVVVVEASEKSGSLITARCALEQGRDVMAVPGSVLSGRNRGSHSLLKDGAKVVETADDILVELGWPAGAEAPKSPSKSLIDDPLLTRMESGEVYRLDELMALTGSTGPKLLARLTELELNGLVRGIAGVGFARVLRTG